MKNLGMGFLIQMDPMLVYKKFSVCSTHFADDSFTLKGNLRNNAVPQPCDNPLSDEDMVLYDTNLEAWKGISLSHFIGIVFVFYFTLLLICGFFLIFRKWL